MAQQLPTDYPIDPTVTSGTALADILNRSDEVFNSTNSGPTRPATIKTGGLWAKTGGAALELFMFDGTTDIPIQSGDFGVSTDAGNITTLGTDGLVMTDGTALDAKYVKIAGDTMTGALAVNSNLSYTGTLTGSTGIIDIGGGQVFKDASGNVGFGTKTPVNKVTINGGLDFVYNNQIIDAAGVKLNGYALQLYNEITDVPSFVIHEIVGRNGSKILSITEGKTIIVGSSANQINLGLPSLQVGGSNGNGMITTRRSSDTYAGQLAFYNPNGRVGGINTENLTTTYETSSDYRLKERVAPISDALQKVLLLKPSTYVWKNNNSPGQGFIAHELQAIVPECVSGTKDEVLVVGNLLDSQGNILAEGVPEPDTNERQETWVMTGEQPVYQGVDTSFLVATLTAAIQEQQALIQSLRADVDALKGVAP